MQESLTNIRSITAEITTEKESWGYQEWTGYVMEAEGKGVEPILEWCRRIYETKQAKNITFREWADKWYTRYKFSALNHLAKIGENNDRLCNIITQRQLPNDWGALHLITTLEDDDLDKIDKLDQSSIRHYKLKKNRENKQKKATDEAENALEGMVIDEIIIGDFREKSDCIPDNSVDLVFIDPPYDRESIPLYEASAEVASRILKPGGHCLAYCGTYALPEILEGMGNHLKYFWMNACIHSGQLARMNMTGLVVGWKPIVWYVKQTRIDTDNFVNDFVSGGQEKDHHEWQQAESEAGYYIEKLCPENGMVVDFFCGGGTTGAVAEKMKRKWMMFEIEESSAKTAMVRIKGIRDAIN